MNRSSAVALLLLALALVWLATRADFYDPPPVPDQRSEDAQGKQVDLRIREATDNSRLVVEDVGFGHPAGTALHHGPVRVRGQVRSAGDPVDGYELVFHPVGGSLDGAEEDWDFTDADGEYEVKLRPGRYIAVHDDDGSWLSTVVVPEGQQDLVVDIDLPFGVIRGRVLDGNIAVGGATVYAFRTATPRSDAMTEALMARAGDARSHSDGSFELRDMKPGQYLVTATYERRHTSPAEVGLMDGGVGNVELHVGEGHTLKGVLRDPWGQTLAMDLLISAGPLSSLAQILLGSEHFTANTGEFVVEGLQPGPLTIFGVGGSGDRDMILQAIVDFRPGQAPVKLIAQQCGSLSVTITRPDGTPVKDAYLDLRSHDGGPVIASLEWLEDGITSDHEGHLELDDVLPGRYRIAPGLRGNLGSPAYIEVLPGETRELTLVIY